MEQISVREFQRNFTAINTKPFKVARNGVVIGSWLPVGQGLSREAKGELKPIVKSRSMPVGQTCNKCSSPAEFGGYIEVAGSESSVSLCKKHWIIYPARSLLNKL